ncbi:MAG: 2,3-bisphosphoglycerate-independent phosphoglycerate mutase [Crocinitomicaceae bacterium]
MTNKFGLIILDGWGLGKKDNSDAVYQANTPYMDSLMASFPNTRLTTFGEAVGLPEGQMGNSEVGHLNIGAGRIVYQELTRINKSIREGDFFQNETLLNAMNLAKEKGRKLHLMGLVSRGGVHSSQEHLYAMCELAEKLGVKHVYIHAFTDGRDCDPKSGKAFLAELEENIADKSAKVATIIGRYYAMDRDNRWERIKEAYDAMVNRIGTPFENSNAAIDSAYNQDITDEFIPASIISVGEGIDASIANDDVVISFNFRTDRPREITTALTQTAFHEQNMHPLQLHYFTMTQYDEHFKNVHVIFEKDNLQNTLGEIMSKLDRTQVRIAETEKYPHVTFFFSGGREEPFEGESRILVNSPKVATYDLQPEMSAIEVKNKIVESIQTDAPDFICLNFANADMVGHTGVFSAIVKAVETVDSCLKEVVEAGREKGYEFLVIADHGNADFAMNADGSPNTAHSMNPVPAVLVTDKRDLQLQEGILADVAPTILRRMGIAAPYEMDGKSLIK